MQRESACLAVTVVAVAAVASLSRSGTAQITTPEQHIAGPPDRRADVNVTEYPNMEPAIDALPDEAARLECSWDALPPPGGHLQGIQMRWDAGRQEHLVFLSHDSFDQAYVVVAAFPESLDRPGHVVHVHRFPRGPLRHAGGIQLAGPLLAVGLEDNRRRDASEIRFCDTGNPADWKPLPHLTIHRRGEREDCTAGAVAVISDNGRLLAAVANWDSRAIDFYRSSPGRSIREAACRMRWLSRWRADQADRAGWTPDDRCGSWQAINFVRDGRGHLYLFGFRRDTGTDTVDVFQVDPTAAAGRQLRKTASRSFHLPAECHFLFGGGVSVQDGRLWLLGTSRRFAPYATIALIR